LDDVVPEDVLAPAFGLFSIFAFMMVDPAEVLPADDLPLSLPGEERSSGTPESCRATFCIGEDTFRQFSDSRHCVSIAVIFNESLISILSS
jgi:hypothetical protein